MLQARPSRPAATSPSTEDDSRRSAVAVIGWDIKDELFPQLDPVGPRHPGRRPAVPGHRPRRQAGPHARPEPGQPGLHPDPGLPRDSSARRDSLNFLIKARGGVPGVEAAVDEVRAVLRALRHTAFRAPDPSASSPRRRCRTCGSRSRPRPSSCSLLIAVGLARRRRHRDHEHHAGGGGRAHPARSACAWPWARASATSAASSCSRRRSSRCWAASIGVALGGLGDRLVVRGVSVPRRGHAARSSPWGWCSRPWSASPPGYWPARTASNLPVVDALRAET